MREDHAYEQYFFDAATCAELVALMRRYDRPLLVCTPSLAVAAEAAGVPHVLLDRDERFAFLPGFRPFDLHNPAATAPALAGYAHDVVICDPPFANVEIPTLRAALDALAPDEARRAAPLYVAFNARREGALRAAFATQNLERKGRLGYCSVKRKTAQHLFLYGPAGRPGLHGH